MRFTRKRKEHDEPADAPLPREIQERIGRVLEYHKGSKHTYQSVRFAAALDWDNLPSPFRSFDNVSQVPLQLPEAAGSPPALAVLADGLAAVGVGPQTSQDLGSLSAWLHLANGLTGEVFVGQTKYRLRSCPSSGALYPFEIYVAAFAIDGLEPGLYHYNARSFSLALLRPGAGVLAQLKKGRPDLEFLKTTPGALLVSSVFARSSWRFRQRGYRAALLDAGHLIQNLITAGNGLGIATTTRLRMNDRTMRDLIGVAPDAPFAEAEAVQAMVVWADAARQSAAPSDGARPRVPPIALKPIKRGPLARRIAPYGSILAAHDDCTAPGVAVRDIRPPLTELSPVGPEVVAADLPAAPVPGGVGLPLRQTMLERRSSLAMRRGAIGRDALWQIARLAFRGGSCFPVFPAGPHVGLVRALFVISDVTGMEPGLWYYDATADQWRIIRAGHFRLEAQYLCLEQAIVGDAAATCFMVGHLAHLMQKAGPDIYRLAHLEAGMVGQRMCMAAEAMGLAHSGIGAFYDDEIIQFLELKEPGWEMLYALTIGVLPTEGD